MCGVCVSVCLSEHAILAVRTIRSITKDAIVLSVRFAAILKRRFLKLFYSKVKAVFQQGFELHGPHCIYSTSDTITLFPVLILPI